MSDKKISELQELTTPDGTEELVVNDGGTSKKIQIDNIFSGSDAVGIGTSSPGSQLHLSKAGGTLIKLGTSNNTSEIEAREVGGGQSLVLSASNSSDDLVIVDSGNVGIGTSSPSQELEISSTTPAVRLTDTSTSGLYHEVVSYGDDLRFSADGGDVEGSTNIEFFIDGTERLRILSSGGITFNGDTAAANALDDYEEGTFTPVVADASSGGNVGSATAKGFYTKIGRQVNMSLYLVNINTTGLTSNNALYIRGFPYTSASTSNHYADGTVRVDGVNYGDTRDTLTAVMTNNDSWCRLFESGDNTSDTTVSVSDVSSGSADIYINITYMT